MTLHAAIEKLLREKGRPMTTQEIADCLNKNKWYQKKDGSKISDFQIHGRTRNYPQIFDRKGSTVSLIGQENNKSTRSKDLTKIIIDKSLHATKDEHYVLDICDKVLGQTSLRQHKFDFLLGDPNSKGHSTKLP